MAKAKKVNTKRSKAWEAFKLGASALVNNGSVIKLRTSKWYAAIIAALASVIVAVVPTLVNYSKLKGSDVLNSPSGGLTNGLISFAETLDTNNMDIVFNAETGLIEIDNTKWDDTFPNNGGYHVYAHTYTVEQIIMQTEDSLNDSGSIETVPTTPIVKEVTLTDLVVYNLSTLDSKALTDTVFGDKNGYTSNGEIAILQGTDPTPALNNPYATSTLFLGKDCFALIKNPNGRDVTKAAAYKIFKYEANTVNLRDLVKQDSRGVAYDIPLSSVNEENYQRYLDAAAASWATLFNDCWESTRSFNMWSQTGIWLAIYVGIVFFMGLMVFLITRGKMNPFNSFTFWQSQKIAYWATMSPGILGLALGFLISRFATLAFLITFGVRILWMAFRNLKPLPQK